MIKNKSQRFLASLLTFILLSAVFLPLPIRAEIPAVTFSLAAPGDLKFTPTGTGETMKDEIRRYSSSVTQPVFDALLHDNPKEAMWINVNKSQLFCSSVHDENQNVVSITQFAYSIAVLPSYTDPKGMTDRVTFAVESFVPQGETLYEKVKSIHDFVCMSTTYDATGSYIYSAYGALIDRRSVCEGYAEAFKLLCDDNGIDCILVIGTAGSQNENHMWNYVRMDDNRWYAVDTTWDDEKGSDYTHNYFLVGTETVINGKGTTFRENHRPNGDLSLTGFKVFSYPDLALQSYLEAATSPGDYPSGQSDKYFYGQLNESQRSIYDRILAELGTQIPSRPDEIPPLTSETDSQTALMTTEPLPTISTSHLETSEDINVTPDTETTVIVTEPPQTTVDQTTLPLVTPPAVTTLPITTPIAPPVTSETVTSTALPPVTTTEAVTTQKETTTTVPPPPSELPTTSEAPAAPPITALPVTTQNNSTATTTAPPQTMETVQITIQPPPTSTPPSSSPPAFLEVLRIVIIVTTLIAVFALVSLVLLRCQHKDDQK